MKNRELKTIILSRTDAIGDVILTLPMASYLKQLWPSCRIVFLGRNYTRDVVAACASVDAFISWDDVSENPIDALKELHADAIIHVFPRKEIARAARKASIELRVGTSHRSFHWFNCNRKVNFTRKNSLLHEAQLNFSLLEGLGIKHCPSLDELKTLFDFSLVKPLQKDVQSLIDTSKFSLILHPGSKGSAREWGIHRFAELIALLPQEQFQIFLTGTEKEGAQFRQALLEPFPQVTDLSGKLSLQELISFIKACKGLVAVSTGPLHIAAATGIHALGIYPPIRPMHPGRWAPLGEKAKVFVVNKECSDCRKDNDCACMKAISADQVANFLLKVKD